MVGTCPCHWEKCKEYSKALREAKHFLSGTCQVTYGPRNLPIRKMIEKHLRVAKSTDTVYVVAYHHWPVDLVTKNIRSKRPFSKYLDREEAARYGRQFVEHSNRCSTILEHSGSIDNEILRSKAKDQYVQTPVVEESDVAFLVGALTLRKLRPFAPKINATGSSTKSDKNPPAIPPTKVATSASQSCAQSQPHLPKRSFAKPIQPVATTVPNSVIRNVETKTPVFDPIIVLPVEGIRQYIRSKVLKNGAANWAKMPKFRDCFQVLQKIHRNFEPIPCYSTDGRVRYFYPCRNIRGDDACELVNVRLYTTASEVHCDRCSPLAKRQATDVDSKRRTAPSSRVPAATLTEDEKVEKIQRLQQDRQRLMKAVARLPSAQSKHNTVAASVVESAKKRKHDVMREGTAITGRASLNPASDGDDLTASYDSLVAPVNIQPSNNDEEIKKAKGGATPETLGTAVARRLSSGSLDARNSLTGETGNSTGNTD